MLYDVPHEKPLLFIAIFTVLGNLCYMSGKDNVLYTNMAEPCPPKKLLNVPIFGPINGGQKVKEHDIQYNYWSLTGHI